MSKEYPTKKKIKAIIICKLEDCKAEAYHLSTVNEHPIGPINKKGQQKWVKTLKYKCAVGHISEQDVTSMREALKK